MAQTLSAVVGNVRPRGGGDRRLQRASVTTMRRLAMIVCFASGCRFGFDPQTAPGTGDAASDTADATDAPAAACAAYVVWGALTSTYRQGSAVDWTVAEADCESDGGHLAVVNDMSERDEIRARLVTNDLDWFVGPGPGGAIPRGHRRSTDVHRVAGLATLEHRRGLCRDPGQLRLRRHQLRPGAVARLRVRVRRGERPTWRVLKPTM
jgi:hypothetical protein